LTTTEKIAGILASRNLSELLGLKEDQWFDAKQYPGYDLTTEAARFEVAKDVSSFANADGGHIIFGLTTTEILAEKTEEVNGLQLLASAAFDASAIPGVLGEYLFPKIPGLSVAWVEDATQTGLGVGVIHVPAMSHDKRFVLMKRVLDGESVLPQIVFGIAVRRGSNSVPYTVEQLHRMSKKRKIVLTDRLSAGLKAAEITVTKQEEKSEEEFLETRASTSSGMPKLMTTWSAPSPDVSETLKKLIELFAPPDTLKTYQKQPDKPVGPVS
jgi:predicted HTH transcriptional regulator